MGTNQKKDKKEMRKLSEDEHNKLVETLPMSLELLEQFFGYLDDHLTEEKSGNPYQFTESFSNENGLEAEKVKEWAAAYGAANDTDILWKLEDVYEPVLRDRI
jgi:hypothetical protein